MKKKQHAAPGHPLALLAVAIWGCLPLALGYITPHFSVFHLFGIGILGAYILMWLIRPVFLPVGKLGEELGYMVMALSGVIGTFACLNAAAGAGETDPLRLLLTFTPFVVLLTLCVTGKKDKVRLGNLLGLVLAAVGAVFCVGNGETVLFGVNTDLLLFAGGAMLCWGVWSVMAENHVGIHPIWVTRRTLFWANLFMLPYIIIRKGLPSFDIKWELPVIIALALFSLVGVGLAFVFYNGAAARLGADAAASYLYLLPVVRLVSLIATGGAPLRWQGIVGAVLIVVAIALSMTKRAPKAEA